MRSFHFLLLFSLLAGCGYSDVNYLSQATLSESMFSLIRLLNNHLDELDNKIEASDDNTCDRIITKACVSEKQNLNFSNCVLLNQTYSGTSELSYDEPGDCATSLAAESLTLSIGATMKRSDNFNSNLGSTKHELLGVVDIEQEPLQLVYKTTNYNLKKLVNNKLENHYRYSTTNLVINQLARSGRKLVSSSITSSYVLGSETASYSVDNVTWVNNCCHPTSGKIDYTVSGGLIGLSGSLSFKTPCGSADLITNGSSRVVNLGVCY